MKKALSTLLAVCLLISMATPTYAAEATTQNVVVLNQVVRPITMKTNRNRTLKERVKVEIQITEILNRSPILQ